MRLAFRPPQPTAASLALTVALLAAASGWSFWLYLQAAARFGGLDQGFVFTEPGRAWLTAGGVALTLLAVGLIWLHRGLIIRGGRAVFVSIAAGGLLLAVIGLALPPIGSSDSYWYALSARGWIVHGLDPYRNLPSEMSSDPLFQRIDPALDHPSPYGPLALEASALPLALTPSPAGQAFGQRLLAVLAYAAAGLLLCRARRDRGTGGQSPDQAGTHRLLAALWFLNPYAAFEVANAGHNEGILVLALAVFMVGFLGRKPIRTGAGLAAAVMIKSWPIILIPSLFGQPGQNQRRLTRTATAGLAVIVLSVLPLISRLTSLTALAAPLAHANPHFFGPVFFVLQAVAQRLTADPTQALTWAKWSAAALAAAAAVGLTWSSRRSQSAARSWLPLALAGLFLTLTPWLQPWYGLAVLPLLAAWPPRPMTGGFVLVGLAAFLGYSAAWTVVALLMAAGWGLCWAAGLTRRPCGLVRNRALNQAGR